VTALPKLRLSHASGSSAEAYLHGAHVTSWIPAGGAEALFLSRAAKLEPGAAIRGGVPVIFPQFAELGPLPRHGFARTRPWERVDAGDDGGASVRLRLRDSDETRRIWPHAFMAELQVELGDDWISLTLSIQNTDDAPISFNAALHTYLRVGDVREAAIEGLHGIRYRDRESGEQLKVDDEREVTVHGELDRVYLNTPPELRVHDRANGRSFHVRSSGFADTVVWNPWAAATAKLPDMEDEEYLEMICVEAAQVGSPVTLEPGARWSGVQRIRIVPG
jgi:glucose-6-phosphate 1-epimerase